MVRANSARKEKERCHKNRDQQVQVREGLQILAGILAREVAASSGIRPTEAETDDCTTTKGEIGERGQVQGTDRTGQAAD